MTAPRHPDDRVDAFLAEGPTDLPDQVFDTVRGEIHRTRQRAVIGPWREPNMSSITRVAFAAAVIGAIALAWVNFGPRSIGPGATPSPSPTQTIAPPTAPAGSSSNVSPGPLCPAVTTCKSGNLDPGAYSFDVGSVTPARVTFAVPAGWTSDEDGFIEKHAGAADELMIFPWQVTHVFDDACHWQNTSLVSAGTTPAELASLLTTQKGRVASAATDTTVGGFPAKALQLIVPADLDVGTCTNGVVRPWPDPGPDLNGGYCCFPAGSVDDVSIVEVGGNRIVFVARHQPGSSAADQAELQSMVDSVVIEPPSAAPSSSGASAAP